MEWSSAFQSHVWGKGTSPTSLLETHYSSRLPHSVLVASGGDAPSQGSFWPGGLNGHKSQEELSSLSWTERATCAPGSSLPRNPCPCRHSC